MKRIPPEIDSLMWAVAESNDTKAISDFEVRYPEHRYELGKRLGMVRGLRGARPSESARVFEPRLATPIPTRPKWVIALGACGLVGLAIASYYGTSWTMPRQPKKPVAPVVKLDPPRSDGGVQYQPPKREVTPLVVPERPKIDPVPETPAYLKPQNLQLAEAPLQTALQLLASQSGLQISFAPGMPNPRVTVDYQSQSAIAVLKDMGEQFGFTAFDQGNSSVLIIPAVQKDPEVSLPKDKVNAEEHRSP